MNNASEWLGHTAVRVETGPPKRTDEPRAGCEQERDASASYRVLELLPIGFASCFLSGLQAAGRDCELEMSEMQAEDRCDCLKLRLDEAETVMLAGTDDCRNRTTKRTSNGRELERVGVEVERADRCRVASWLIGERELQLSGMQAENGWS
ncbi:hypothetical protein F2Q69_00046900 [Brassica cretica]|uniref:Uncharacterized protein n=1 Tax=Brassica cretica TaxID=69181 RepID=A0A8S9PYT1_BRACR|nr:hypothetical protein F2Q69_00046900 [Brassica cretica]